jgi:hypothetical protein
MADKERPDSAQPANECIAYAEAVGRSARDDSRQWVFDEFNRLVREDPEAAWPLIRETVQRSGNDQILAFVAAGPLEDLVRLHACRFIDRMERRRMPRISSEGLCQVCG